MDNNNNQDLQQQPDYQAQQQPNNEAQQQPSNQVHQQPNNQMQQQQYYNQQQQQQQYYNQTQQQQYYSQPNQSSYGVQNEPPISLGDWILTLIVLAIPCVNIIMLFVWGFSSGTNKSKQNYCRAVLIFILAAIIISLLLGTVLVGFLSRFIYYFSY
ncbi:MAG: hypothetical protein GX321_09530 [Clostridiales bacterium]|nr:hypothetical protein [Clostridiales bacterium]